MNRVDIKNRADFQKLAALRIKEAKVLLDNRCYEGAYYLAGYAIECALKACIAKKTKRYDFPPPPKMWGEYYSHKLENLIVVAGLGEALKDEGNANARFWGNWNTVKGWNEQSRYELNIDEKRARDLHAAITDKKHGVLRWLKKFW